MTNEGLKIGVKSRKPVVIGFMKAGQSSLTKWLDCKKIESAWREDALDTYERIFETENYQPIFIIRHPIMRAWSHYWYFKWYEKFSWREFLQLDGVDGHGVLDPIEQSNYFKWISKFKKHNPLVVRLEDMEMIDGFPKENINPHKEISTVEYMMMKTKLEWREIKHGYVL